MHLLLIGCGNIGKALLHSWEKSQENHEVIVVQPSLAAKELFSHNTIQFVANPQQIPNDFNPDAIIIAVKPQVLSDVLPHYQRYARNTLFISVAAGTTIAYLQQHLSDGARVVRVMPNVAMQVAASANLAVAAKNCDAKHKDIAANLFASSGAVIWLEQEAQLDILTPISGSGPAYFFLLAQLLIDEAVALGIAQETASHAVRQTLLGSALLAEQHPDLIQLKKSVTSKGGTTEAALGVLEPALPKLIKDAIASALARQEKLAS